MIEELYLKGIGGVREAHLVFQANFCVITGESGSGKSSIIRALELSSGRRAQSTLLHGDVDEGEVLAVLHEDEPRENLQGQAGLKEQEALLVRRVLTKGGRSRSYLQDRPASLNEITDRMERLLRIQSQFAQMELMDPRHQLDLLDHFGGDRTLSLRKALEKIVLKGVEQEKAARAIRKRREQQEERLAHAQKVLDLGRGIGLAADLETRLVEELSELDARAEKHKAFAKSLWELQGGPGSAGLYEGLEASLSALMGLIQEEADSPWEKDSEAVLNGLGRILSRLKGWVREENLEDLEEARERAQKRWGRLQKMKRLAGVQTVPELQEFCRESEKEIRWMVESAATLESLVEEARASRREASRLAMDLREVRSETAKALEREINGYLRELLMDSSTFHVRLTPREKLRTWGADEVSFDLHGAGDFSGPVSAVASGGELSRIQLALQLCLPPERLPSSLVFDEVEAGLGGRAALEAGKKLSDLSEKCQVILVTHEAAIAALARQHFLVEREGARSHVREITGERRVREIARMLAGTGTSPEALNHARVLLGGPQPAGCGAVSESGD